MLNPPLSRRCSILLTFEKFRGDRPTSTGAVPQLLAGSKFGWATDGQRPQLCARRDCKKGQSVLRNGRRPGRLVFTRRRKCQRAIATQLLPKQVNRFQQDRTTPAVRQTKPLMAWTPPPNRCGTRQKTRLLVPRRMISKKHRYLTGQARRQKFEGEVSCQLKSTA